MQGLICVEFDKNVRVESYEKRNTFHGDPSGDGEHKQLDLT